MRKRTTTAVPSWRMLARLFASITLVLLGTACRPADKDRTARYLDEWYSCIECVGGQLDSLVMQGRGPDADSVWRELSRAVRIGPRTADLGAFQSAAEADYDSVQASLQRLGQETLSESKSDYAKGELDTYVRLYRARAAIALVKIDNARARAVVDSAAQASHDQSLIDAFTRTLRDTL